MDPDLAWRKWRLETALARREHRRLRWWRGLRPSRIRRARAPMRWIGEGAQEVSADGGKAGDASRAVSPALSGWLRPLFPFSAVGARRADLSSDERVWF
jgi:hypothetical protein